MRCIEMIIKVNVGESWAKFHDQRSYVMMCAKTYTLVWILRDS